MQDSPSQRIAIIGGGFSGIMVAYHLIHSAPHYSVTIFEQHAQNLAGGNSYAPSSPHHILNVPAETMGATASDSEAFYRWLHTHGRAVSRSEFVSRAWYGEYLQETLKLLRASSADRLSTSIDEVTDVVRLPSQELELRTASGIRSAYNHVVVATGTTPRQISVHGAHATTSTRIVMQPWHQSIFKNAEPTDTIAIIGSGLSAVDILVESEKIGFEGSFIVLAPHGLFPCIHAQDLRAVPPLPEVPRWRTVREAFRGIRTLAAAYPEWQHAIDAVRPHLNFLWNSLSLQEKNRFFRHAATYWDRHRHRMPHAAAAVIAKLRQEQRLTVHTAHVSHIRAEPSHVSLKLKSKSAGIPDELAASRVVNCSGFTLDVQRFPSALAQSLLAHHLGYVGHHGRGWRCTSEGALCNEQGRPIPGMWVMGSLRRGTEFECTAAKELRVQAEALAKSIVNQTVRF